jgi:hypothetical protein
VAARPLLQVPRLEQNPKTLPLKPGKPQRLDDAHFLEIRTARAVTTRAAAEAAAGAAL